MMDPVEPTTHVYHQFYGDLVVVAAAGISGADLQAEVLEKSYGPGTWTIKLLAHKRALKAMNEGGVASISEKDIQWFPWKDLTGKDN